MKNKIIKITGQYKKTNSSFGNFAIPCIKEYTYNNGIKKQMDTFHYTWTEKKAKEITNNRA